MDEDLQSDYDLIVYGTGLVECLLAGAAARVGKSVLHLDRHSFYGGQWASFSLSGLCEWTDSLLHSTDDKYSEKCTKVSQLLSNQEQLLLLKSEAVYSNVTSLWHVEDAVGLSPPTQQRSADCAKVEVAAEHVLSPQSQQTPADSAVEAAAENVFSPPTQQSPTDSAEVEVAAEDEPIAVAISDDMSATWHWSHAALLEQSRKFNIDLAPKILYSRGEMVELLISSNVARYVEFKCNARLLCWLDDRLASVPCSRAEVFRSRAVSLLDKRLLMKFLTFAADYTQYEEKWREFEHCPLHEYLSQEHITGALQQYVLWGMVLSGADVTVGAGLQALKIFLTSLGRYGSGPFLMTLYGSGELPQAFCRLCAVFGGTYILGRGISSVIVGTKTSAASSSSCTTPADTDTTMTAPEDSSSDAVTAADGESVVAVVSDGHRINCRHLVADACYGISLRPESREELLPYDEGTTPADAATRGSGGSSHRQSLSRAVLIVSCDLLREIVVTSPEASADAEEDQSNNDSKGQGVSMLQMPGPAGVPVTVLQLATDTATTAPGTWLVHLTAVAVADAQADLTPVVQQLLQHCAAAEDGVIEPVLLYSLYFNQIMFGDELTPYDNVHLCGGPDCAMDYGAAVRQARTIFARIYPDEEFMPRAPDSDEIIFDDPQPEKIEKESMQDVTKSQANEEEAGQSVSPMEEAESRDISDDTS